MDVIKELIEGNAQFEWFPFIAEDSENHLTLFTQRDAIKFAGVRRAFTALQLQQFADLTNSMLLTPKMGDLIHMQATTRFDAIVRVDGDIAANSTDERMSEEIDKRVAELGDKGGLISSVGKPWSLANKLSHPDQCLFKEATACNYGWHNRSAPSLSVTRAFNVYQTPGFRHNHDHIDPSQTGRTVYRKAVLVTKGVRRVVDIVEILQGPLASLLSHEGKLTYLRQRGVPEPEYEMIDGFKTYPTLSSYAAPKWLTATA